MDIESNESDIIIKGGIVEKIYKPRYYRFNQDHNRKGEAYFLKKYKSPYFVELIAEKKDRIELKYAGKPIGKRSRNEQGEYVFNSSTVRRIGRGNLINWLLGLQKELERLNIEHRDISPPNILFDDRELKLIDFSWAIEGIENKEEKEKWQAPYPDKKYINILIKQIR